MEVYSHDFSAYSNPAELTFVPFEVGLVRWHKEPGQPEGDKTSSGIWKVTPEDAPEPFDLPIHQTETIYIIEGHLTIEVEGYGTYDMVPGSIATFYKGCQTRWTVHEPTLEFFSYN